ncbi:MAG: hypothetical protein ABI977_01380 [Acidobacteriota bacterium]
MQEVNLEYVERLASQLSPQDQRSLVARLEHQLYVAGLNGKQPRSLWGIWKGKMPEDIDLDAELYEIRHEWEKELEEFGL